MYALENIVIALKTGEKAFIERPHQLVTMKNGWQSQFIIINDQILDA